MAYLFRSLRMPNLGHCRPVKVGKRRTKSAINKSSINWLEHQNVWENGMKMMDDLIGD